MEGILFLQGGIDPFVFLPGIGLLKDSGILIVALSVSIILRLSIYRSNQRGPKKSKIKRNINKNKPHVSAARIIGSIKNSSATLKGLEIMVLKQRRRHPVQ